MLEDIKLIYEVKCQICNKIEYYERLVDFDTSRCNDCSSIVFGLKKHKRVRKTHEEAKQLLTN